MQASVDIEVIPAIDIAGGQCVRLFQGRFESKTRYDVDPVALAAQYADAGCQWLHLVDLDGAATGHQKNLALVRAITESTDLSVQIAGGVRNRAQVSAWLERGAKRVVLGTLAVEQPNKAKACLEEFGPERIVLAFDVAERESGPPEVVTRGWRRSSGCTLWQMLDAYQEAELRHVLCTDVSRDGAMTGPNVDLYETCVARCNGIRFQASGGVRGRKDLAALTAAAVPAVIVGRALLEGRLKLAEVYPSSQNE